MATSTSALASTVAMLRGAFPHGLSREDVDYRRLLTVLYRSEGGLSFSNLAEVIAVAFGIDRGVALNDTYGVDKLELKHCGEVIELLRRHGFDEWNTERDVDRSGRTSDPPGGGDCLTCRCTRRRPRSLALPRPARVNGKSLARQSLAIE